MIDIHRHATCSLCKCFYNPAGVPRPAQFERVARRLGAEVALKQLAPPPPAAAAAVHLQRVALKANAQTVMRFTESPKARDSFVGSLLASNLRAFSFSPDS